MTYVVMQQCRRTSAILGQVFFLSRKRISATRPAVVLFDANRTASLRAGCKRADSNAGDTRYYSVGLANLYLASDRGRSSVLVDCLQRGQHAQSGCGDHRRISLPHYRAVIAADPLGAAQPWRN